jgi:hypothetical protein
MDLNQQRDHLILDELYDLPTVLVHLIEEYLGEEIAVPSYTYTYSTLPGNESSAVTLAEQCPFNTCPLYQVELLRKAGRLWSRHGQIGDEWVIRPVNGYEWTSCRGNLVRRLFCTDPAKIQEMRKSGAAEAVAYVKQLVVLNQPH